MSSPSSTPPRGPGLPSNGHAASCAPSRPSGAGASASDGLLGACSSATCANAASGGAASTALAVLPRPAVAGPHDVSPGGGAHVRSEAAVLKDGVLLNMGSSARLGSHSPEGGGRAVCYLQSQPPPGERRTILALRQEKRAAADLALTTQLLPASRGVVSAAEWNPLPYCCSARRPGHPRSVTASPAFSCLIGILCLVFPLPTPRPCRRIGGCRRVMLRGLACFEPRDVAALVPSCPPPYKISL